jgi:hypothetical protein
VAASIGLLNGAPIEFELVKDVPDGGVLFALPALLLLGLLSKSREMFSMPEGFYPLESIFLLLALMALARIPSLEALRYVAPGEWGKLMGLDRIPEVRTLLSPKISQAKALVRFSGYRAPHGRARVKILEETRARRTSPFLRSRSGRSKARKAISYQILQRARLVQGVQQHARLSRIELVWIDMVVRGRASCVTAMLIFQTHHLDKMKRAYPLFHIARDQFLAQVTNPQVFVNAG